MFRLSVATDAKHLTDVSAKNIDNCIEQVKVGKNIFSVNMQITITNCEKGDSFYFRVRAYKQNGSGTKYYSAWSTKSVKVTK